MQSLNGLPDFQTPLSTASVSMFAPFQGGSYAVLPQLLALAVADASGTPKFQLDLVQRFGDFDATGQYAVLDFSLAGDFALDAALAAARVQDARAIVSPAAIAGGFARLYPTAGEVSPSSDALAPVPLGLNGPDFARWTTRLTADSGELIKGAISGGSLLLGARVEFETVGVAPRVAAIVEFQAPQLLASLLAGKTGRLLATTEVLSAFTGITQSFPLKIINGSVPTGDFAGAVASRIFAAFATLAPSPGISDPPYVALADPAQLDASPIQWDLSQAALGRRQWVLTLDILTSLRAFATANGIASLVKYVTVPALQDGFFSVEFDVNLPAHRLGVAALGANVAVAANPPLRPDSIAQSIAFEEPADSGSLQLRLSPSEQLAYTVSGFAVVAAGQTVKEYQMPARPGNAARMELGADDFPVTFAHVTAAPRLLALATLAVVLTYRLDGQACQLQAELTAQAAEVALAIPRSATDASLSVGAAPLDGSPALTLAPMEPGRIDLDVTAFQEYGPHRIAITATFDPGEGPMLLEFISDDAAQNSAAVPDEVFLTLSQAQTTWGYVASSPFRAGYRYRKSQTPAAVWSPSLSPFQPLELNADATPLALARTP